VTLAWTLYYLALYPDVQRKLQAEADRVLPDHCTAQDFELQKLPYCHNVIREVLRHRPVGPLIGLTTNTTVTLLGHTLLPGTDVRCLTRLVTLKATPTADPFAFNPDRWDLDESSELYRRQSNATLAFGHGPRICPGRHLAMVEMVIIVSLVFAKYDISFFPLPTGHEEVHEVSSFTMKPENLHLLFKHRKHAAVVG
jgi:cytochrome P450